ncbi:MAG TPA: cupin domain-containing protein [Kofleriaceae bacterium]|nr:cupin domain-containing protein [Kofleriaceae bacterium]
MRIDLRSLSLLLVIGCGGGGGASDTTTTPMPPADEPVAETTPPPETPPAEEPAPPAEPVKPVIPDALTAGPDIYKLAFENDKVRVFEVVFAPGAKIAMHQHPDHAVYALVGGTLKITSEAGETKDMALKTGDAGYFPGESHSAENATDKEVRVALVEIKPGASFTEAPKAGDPLKVGKGYYKKVFENEKVRIMTVKFKKNGSIKAHTHPDHVVFVTKAGTLQVSPAEGEPVNMDLTVGQATMIDGGIHAAKATKGTPEVIVFELKPAAK